MGRPRKTLTEKLPFFQFASELRLLRQAAGDPTLAELSRRTGYSIATLCNAESGKKLPTWDVVQKYVTVCGGVIEDWSKRWRMQKISSARGPSGTLPADSEITNVLLRRIGTAPTPVRARTAKEFVLEMKRLVIWDGNPTYRHLEVRSGGELPRSTLSDALRLTPARLPRTSFLEIFLTVLGVHDRQQIYEWAHALERLRIEEYIRQQTASPPHLRKISPSSG